MPPGLLASSPNSFPHVTCFPSSPIPFPSFHFPLSFALTSFLPSFPPSHPKFTPFPTEINSPPRPLYFTSAALINTPGRPNYASWFEYSI